MERRGCSVPDQSQTQDVHVWICALYLQDTIKSWEHIHYKFSFLLFTTSNSSQDIRVIHSYGSTQAATCEAELNILFWKESLGGIVVWCEGAGEGKEVKTVPIEVLTQSVESGVGAGQILEERRG